MACDDDIINNKYHLLPELEAHKCDSCGESFVFTLSRKRQLKKYDAAFYKILCGEPIYIHHRCLEKFYDKYIDDDGMLRVNGVNPKVYLYDRWSNRMTTVNYGAPNKYKKYLTKKAADVFSNRVAYMYRHTLNFAFHCDDYKFIPEYEAEFKIKLGDFQYKGIKLIPERNVNYDILKYSP